MNTNDELGVAYDLTPATKKEEITSLIKNLKQDKMSVFLYTLRIKLALQDRIMKTIFFTLRTR